MADLESRACRRLLERLDFPIPCRVFTEEQCLNTADMYLRCTRCGDIVTGCQECTANLIAWMTTSGANVSDYWTIHYLPEPA